MYVAIKKVMPLDEYKLLLIFDNNEERILDMSTYLNYGIFKELKDKELFKTVRVSFDTIEWKNGADLCPEEVYNSSIKK